LFLAIKPEAVLAEARLTGSDKRTLLLWIFFGVLGGLFAHHYFFRAFPEASVDFKVSRSEAQNRARNFVESLGENPSGYQSTITFELDDNAKTYLERELGLQEANRLMSGELNIWYWEVRFFRSQQEEEYRVRVNPAGQVVGYQRTIEEARAGKSLTREEAFSAAGRFLQTKLRSDLSRWEFLPEEVNSEKRPNRLDWSFTWERKNFRAKEAPYRLKVGLQGENIGSTQEFLQVPEAWTRDYQHLRSTNLLYNQLALLPYGFLMGAAIWLGISLTRQGKTTWGAPLKIGALVAILFFLMQINQWDSFRAAYNTREAYASFVAMGLAKLIVAALATGLMVTLVLPGAEPLYRAAQPERLQLYKAFSLRGLRGKEFFSSSVVGLSLAAAHIGFIVAFYMIGSQHGVWAPQDLNYSGIVNTTFPWIAGVAIGVMAATSEEFLFRLFAIPFLRRMTGSRVLAIILPAFFWSFLHSAYPQEPGYIRGIEVGIIGIVAGIVMLRWGILATLTWHYTVDASLVGMLLIRSDNLYFKISGIIVGLAALAPLTLSAISYLRRGHFENVDDLLNSADPAPEISLQNQISADTATTGARRYDALSSGMIGFLAICILVGGGLAWKFKTQHVGDYLKMLTNRRTAIAGADLAMRAHGQDPNSFHKTALFLDNTLPTTNEFLRRRMPIADVNAIYANRIPGAVWRVRYFRDSQPEEFAVVVKPDGSVHGYWHTVAEAAKGASLSKEQAQAIAENYLREQKHIDLTGWSLVQDNARKKPNRVDHVFTWQQDTPLDPGAGKNSDHAYARIELTILGDEPVDYRTYIKIPEDFVRNQDKGTLPRTIFGLAQYALLLGLLVAVLVGYFRRFRTPPVVVVPWRRIFGWGIAALIAAGASFLLGRAIPAILSNYPTEMPLPTYYIIVAVAVTLLGMMIVGALSLTFGLGWFFGARAFGEERVPSWLGMPANYYRDAFWIAAGGTALLVGLKRVLEALSAAWPTMQRSLPAHFGNPFDALFPATAAIGGAIVAALFYTAIIALASGFLGSELRARWARFLLFLVVAAPQISDWGSPADFLKQFLTNAILLALAVFGVRIVARFNLLGIFLLFVIVGLLGTGFELLSQPDAYYRMQGYEAMFAVAVALALPLIAWRLNTGKTAPVA
jgi:membrane protease YdiL (CAAX protease family)